MTQDALPGSWYHTAAWSAKYCADPPGYPSFMTHISSPKKFCVMT